MPRPLQPLATRESVAKVALSLIDEHGLSALSTRKIAARLGVTSAALYHHFGSKEEMLDLVVRRAFHGVREPDRSIHWTDQSVQLSHSFRQSLLAHPNLGPVMLNYRYRAFTSTFMVATARAMISDGVPARFVPIIINSLEVYTYGSATVGQVAPSASRRSDLEPYPDILEAFDKYDEDSSFTEGLLVMIDGWVTRIRDFRANESV
jgi:TetR/AcrR family tetracycline transcriptional repressor